MHETHKCPLNRAIEVSIYMAIDDRILLNPWYCHSCSLEVESGVSVVGVGRRGGDSDWGIPRSQKLCLYTNGMEDFDQSRLREKFWITRSVGSRPLGHATHASLARE